MEENYNLLEPHHFNDKPPKDIKNWHIWVVLIAVAASLMIAIAGVRSQKETVPENKDQAAPINEDSIHSAGAKGQGPQQSLQPAPPSAHAVIPSETSPAPPRIAIIIDDLGNNLDIGKRFASIEASISLAVLPHTPHGRQIAKLAMENGHEVILHVPMEPYDYPETDPGPGTLLSNMSPEKLIETLEKDLASVPQAIGISNHMGSKLTADPAMMEPVMKYLKDHDLIFIDSLTAPNTVAYSVAKKIGLRTARRTMFLDNIKDINIIEKNILDLAENARKVNGLIGIAHPYQATFEALQNMLPQIEEKGIQIVPLSALVK